MYLLDTNTCIIALNRRSPSLVAQLRSRSPAEVRISSIVKAELYFGARKSARLSENLELLGRFLAPYVAIPFDDLCAEHYGMIRADLERDGRPIGPNDLLIAATARAADLTLVTTNTREFARVPGLRLEDWTSAPR
jgi:tRNA(fMet)-specific endonuclease VapC